MFRYVGRDHRSFEAGTGEPLMRAAKAAPAWTWRSRPVVPADAGPKPAPKVQVPSKRHAAAVPFYPVIGMAAVFLAGYMGGILLCRSETPAVGGFLAKYYMDKQNFSSFFPAFSSQYAGSLLLILLLLLCGGCIVGFALVPALFAIKGAMLGICAASVLVQEGTRGLVVYWLLTCLPDMATLLLMLWVAQAGWVLSSALLRNLLDGAAVRGALKVKAQGLLLRGLLAILAGGAAAAVGTAAAMLFAGVLL